MLLINRKQFKVVLVVSLIIISLAILTAATAQASTIERAIEKAVTYTATQVEESRWQSIGKQRITTYCPSCNDPAGYQSASGQILYEGAAACNWLPVGTQIRIDGIEYTIIDTCGTDAIDLFQDTSGCYCNTNEYRNVEIYEK